MLTVALEEQPYIELAALLKVTDVCHTGGEAKILIQSGAVLVDGETETRRRKKIRPGQFVTFAEIEGDIAVVAYMDKSEEDFA